MSPYWVLGIILGVVILTQFTFKEVWVNYPGPDNAALKVWGAGKGMRTRQGCPGLTARLCPLHPALLPPALEAPAPTDSFLELVVKNHSQLQNDCCRNMYTMDIGKHFKSGLFGFVCFVSESQFTSIPLNTTAPRKKRRKKKKVIVCSFKFRSRCVTHSRRFHLQTVQIEGVWGLKETHPESVENARL